MPVNIKIVFFFKNLFTKNLLYLFQLKLTNDLLSITIYKYKLTVPKNNTPSINNFIQKNRFVLLGTVCFLN